MATIRVGDLVTHCSNEDKDTGIVIRIKKREVASPHPNYKGKNPPIELKVVESVEVMWGDSDISTHDALTLERVKRK